MAKVIFQQLLSDKNNINITADSAGLFTSPGLPASDSAIRVMFDMGLDLSSHSSQVINESLMTEADLVLTMTREQRLYLAGQFPKKEYKIFTLGQFIGQTDRDIEDPYGRSLEMYRKSSQEIKEILIKVMNKLLDDKTAD
jgi:protein-tyrosine-phosphatase